jgi:HK97 family phage major capsid protein
LLPLDGRRPSPPLALAAPRPARRDRLRRSRRCLDPKALITQLNAAFEEFKTTNDQKLAAKVDDVLLNEKMTAINATMSDLEKALDEHAAKIAAATLGNAPGDMQPTDPEYLKAFKAHMRRGDVRRPCRSAPRPTAAISLRSSGTARSPTS